MNESNSIEKITVPPRIYWTIEDIANYLQMSKRAVYMHYHRGHLVADGSISHRLYFSTAAVEDFINLYKPFQALANELNRKEA